MAEALAIVAAAVGLAQTGAQLVLSISWLCTALASAPKEVTQLSNSVKLLIGICEAIERHQNALQGTAVTLADLEPILLDCIDQTRALATKLNKLVATPDASILKKGWKAVVAVKKEKSMLSKCEKIERAKKSLVLWFSTFTALQSNGNHDILLELRRDIESILASTGNLSILPTLEAKVDHLDSAVAGIHHMVESNVAQHTLETKSLELLQNRTSELQISVQQSSIEAQNASAEQNRKIESVAPSIDALVEARLQATNALLEDKIERSNANSREAVLNAIQELGASFSANIKEVSKLTESPQSFRKILDSQSCLIARRQERAQFEMSPFEKKICSCSPKRSRARTSLVPFVTATTESLVHSASCPAQRYQKKSVKRTFEVKIAPGILHRALIFFYESKLGVGGNSIISYSNVVQRRFDSESSSTFHAIFDFFIEQRRSPERASSEEDFHKLLDIINDKLTKRETTIFDLGPNGDCLVNYAVFWATFWVEPSVAREYQDMCCRLIKFLIGWGARPDIPNDRNWSALDSLVFPSRYGSADSTREFEPLRRFLISWGCEPTVIAPFGERENSIEWLWPRLQIMDDFPEFFEDWKCGPVTCAVIQKDYNRLQSLLENGCNISERNVEGQTPLHISTDWTRGLKLLLSYRADPNSTDRFGYLPLHYALTGENLESFKCLLDGGSILETNPSLNHEHPHRATVPMLWNSKIAFQKAFWGHVAQRNKQSSSSILMRHSDRSYEENDDQVTMFGYSSGYVEQDRTGELNLNPLQSPQALSCTSPFHWGMTYLREGKRFPLDLAEFLYDTGFHDLDVTDGNGFTPLFESSYRRDHDMIAWLLQKGASLRQNPNGYDPLHMLGFGDPWRPFYFPKSQDFRGLVKSVKSLLNRGSSMCARDYCNCPCSPDGCSFFSIVLRKISFFGYGERLEFFLDFVRGCLADEIVQSLELKSHCTTWARIVLFEHLEMQHTCCWISDGRLVIQSADEAARIDENRLALLDELDERVDKYEEELEDSNVLMESEMAILEFHRQWLERECPSLEDSR